MSLSQLDVAVRKRVGELSGSSCSTEYETARENYLTACGAVYDLRGKAASAARELSDTLMSEHASLVAVDRALRAVRDLTGEYQEWRRIASAYKKYVFELHRGGGAG